MSQYPKVSVCMITYGHENYIRQAIEGVLMQDCNFEVELILSNDCSLDQTDYIIQDILSNHPRSGWIKYFKQNKNLGIMPNFFFALEQCSGKYVAMCEGDDFWITKDKLRKQVEILEENEEIGLVYTDVKQFIQRTGQFIDIPARFVQRQSDVIPEMLKSKFIEFATTMFRKTILDEVVKKIKEELKNKVIGDTRIILETVYISKLHYLNEVTAVYRILEGSASHPKEVDKYIFAIKDSYLCRKSFVKRNKLNTIWLSDAICNTNRGLINNAFVAKKYIDVIKLLKNVLIVDVFKYCNWNIFRKKMKIHIWIKLILSLVGVGILRQKLR
ncbi:glycosyltransferase [Flavobacterium undicola]|uniref:glycosyltransferase n=1 Tax=Flavobacterium undicola TaxID=1932779 RepID=UPI001377A735|nr:glycosyltransferase [Flavobacterium undicola]MBA0884754.1 glycosyltransferase [Flavobacterium undicola]